jgi:hypothetical protein
MSVRKPLALSAIVIAALTTAVPAATAGAAPMPPGRAIAFSPPSLPVSNFSPPRVPVSDPSTNPQYATCPASYGFKNPATGCESWADYFAYTGGGQPGQ